MGDLAKQAVLAHGKGEEGKRAFLSWCDELEARIPAGKTDTLRQVRDLKARDRAWIGACDYIKEMLHAVRTDKLGYWKPLQKTYRGIGPRRPSKGAWRVYEGAASIVTSLKLDPHCFEMGYAQWADVSDYDDPNDCRRVVDTAERNGMLFRLDRGQSGDAWLRTLVTLVGAGETLQDAYDAGICTEAYKQRLTERARLGLPPAKGAVINNQPRFEPSRTKVPEPQTVAA